MINSLLISKQQRDAYKAIRGWSDVIHMSASEAADVMTITTGQRVLAKDAEKALRRERRLRSVDGQVYETVSNFQRDSIGKALGNNIGTTTLYKFMTGARMDDLGPMDPDVRVYEQSDAWLMHGHPGHTIRIPKDGRWSFNDDLIHPSFTPSIDEGEGGHHFFVRNGVVEYLGLCDCLEIGEPVSSYPIPAWRDN